MPKQIRDLSCSVSSFKCQLDTYFSTILDTPYLTKSNNSLENSTHANPHPLTGVHTVSPDTVIKDLTTTSITVSINMLASELAPIVLTIFTQNTGHCRTTKGLVFG